MDSDTAEKNSEELFQIAKNLVNNHHVFEAMDFFEQAAEMGNMKAMKELVVWFLRAQRYCKTENVIRYAKTLADSGDVESMKNLAIIYRGKDILKSIEWFEKVAELGSSYAMRELGQIYCRGTYIEKNIQKAIEWYEKAAELGNFDAMHDLAVTYQRGNGVEKNIQKAIEWYEKAAKLDDWESMRALAKIYRDGDGVEKNEKKAAELLKRIDDKLDTLLNGVISY